MAFVINVWDGVDHLLTVHAGTTWTVRDLKADVEMKTMDPVANQRIYLAGTIELPDKQAIDPEELRRLLEKIQPPHKWMDEDPRNVEDICLTKRTREQAKWLKRVQEVPTCINHTAPEEVKMDRDVMLIAISNFGNALQHLPEPMIYEVEYTFLALKQNGEALEFAKERFRDDRQIVHFAVQQSGLALAHACSQFRSDKEIVQLACAGDGWALHWSTEELRSDKDIVMAAVSTKGRSLCYASTELRADREVVLAALRQDGFALEFASEDLRGDGDVVLVAVRQAPDSLKYACVKLQMHRTMLHVATKSEQLLKAPRRATWDELCKWHTDVPERPQYRWPPYGKSCVKAPSRTLDVLKAAEDEEEDDGTGKDGAAG